MIYGAIKPISADAKKKHHPVYSGITVVSLKKKYQ